MSHVVYRTFQYEEMIAWYQEVFAARVTSRNAALTFLTFDGESHRFAIGNLEALRPDSPTSPTSSLVGVDHIAYTFASLEALFANYERLQASGISPYWCIHHGNTVSMYYADPDENQMEFQVETLAAQEAARLSPEARAQINGSIGIEFDPDLWLQRLKAGTSEEELLVRVVHEPVSPVRGSVQRGYRFGGKACG